MMHIHVNLYFTGLQPRTTLVKYNDSNHYHYYVCKDDDNKNDNLFFKLHSFIKYLKR